MSDDVYPRERGILTPADREFLRSPDEYSRQATYQRNQKIRERVKNAVFDFGVLAQHLDEEVLNDLFAPVQDIGEDEEGTYVRSEVPPGKEQVPAGIAFLAGVRLADERRDVDLLGIEQSLSPFVSAIELGIQMYLNYQHGITADVDVDLSVTNPQRIDDYRAEIDEIVEREGRLSGRERLEAVSRLTRAGYSIEEIMDLVGPVDAEGEDTEEE